MPLKSSFDTLAHVVEIANSSVDVSERLEGILGVITGNMNGRLAVLFMQEKRDGKLVSSYFWPKPATPPDPLSVDFGDGLVGRAAATGPRR